MTSTEKRNNMELMPKALLLVLALSAYPLLPVPRALAQEARPASAPSFASWDYARLQAYLAGSLKAGRFYVRAIQAAQEAVKRNPKSSQAQLLLGSACVGRFASLSAALRQGDVTVERRTRYQQKHDEWEQTQTGVEPVPPPVLVTPDDTRPFTLTPEQARAQMTDLARQAIAAFQSARDLSETGTLDDKLQCELARGWGLLLLKRDPSRIVRDTSIGSAAAPKREMNPVATSPDPVSIAQSDIVESFDKCVALAPDNVQAVQSLALSLALSNKKSDRSRAAQTFDKAVALSPKNFDLLYQAAVFTTEPGDARAIEYLNRALKRQSANAVVWYVLADQFLKQAESQPGNAESLVQKAKDTIQDGNRAPLYQSIPFALPVPASLKAAWQLCPLDAHEQDTLLPMLLVVNLAKHLKTDVKRDETAVQSDATLMMNLGLRLLGSIETATLSTADSLTVARAYLRITTGSNLCQYAKSFLTDNGPTNPSRAYQDLLEQFTKSCGRSDQYDRYFRTILY